MNIWFFGYDTIKSFARFSEVYNSRDAQIKEHTSIEGLYYIESASINILLVKS
jgi:hypothetical protein